MSFIQQILQDISDKSLTNGQAWCATLEAQSDSEKWVQLTKDAVNLRVIGNAEAPEVLGAIEWPVAYLEMDAWEADTYITLYHSGGDSIAQVADFVARYMEQHLKVAADAAQWNVSEESL